MRANSQAESAPGRGLALPPERHCLFVQTVLALAVVVIGIKLGKLFFAFLQFQDHDTPFQLIYTSWLVRILVVTVIALLVGRILGPRWRWKIAFVALAGLLLAKLAWAAWRRQPDITYVWLQEAAQQFLTVCSAVYGAVRMDLAFLAGFAVLVYLATKIVPARYERALRAALTLLTTFFLLLSGLELAQYIKTGTTGTGHLFAFFVTHAVDLGPMLWSGLDLEGISALVMPLLVGWAVAVLVRRRYAKTAAKNRRHVSPVLTGAVAMSFAAGYIHPVLVDHRFDRFNDNTYLGLRDLVPWRNAGQLEATKQANRLPVIFDTSKAVVRASAEAALNRKNVIIIMLESARADSTSVYDTAKGNTPFLAAFAKRGAVVQDMYTVIPRTSAAWVAVLDGVWPSTEEEMTPWAYNGHPFRSLPALLATQGYASAFFTTTHTNFRYDAAVLKGMDFGSIHDADSMPSQGFEEPSFWGFEDRMMLEPSLNWIKAQREKQQPFLLVMMTNVGHFTYEYPTTWRTRSFGNTDANYEKYLNCLGYIDSVMKDFITGLDNLGMLSSTLVIILGDHGESFGEHGSRAHALGLYEGTLKIPGIVYADGVIKPGTSISGLRQEVDILPTVLDVLGLTLEDATVPGTSMLKPVPIDRPLYFSGALYSQATAMRKGDLKFIYNFGRIPTEAYAVARDPGERHDVASTLPRSVVEQAEMEMLVWRERVSREYALTAPVVGATR